MKFAIPIVNGRLSEHFGYCEEFAIIETNNKKIISEKYVASPPDHHEGEYPQFLKNKGVNIIITGGIGQQAIDFFKKNNIKVYAGVNSDYPMILVENYLNNKLDKGFNLCDH